VEHIEIVTLGRSIRPPNPHRPDPGKVLLLVNGVIITMGGIYASTNSVAATAVAGCAGLGSAALYVWKK
jgi:hypothetical protein